MGTIMWESYDSNDLTPFNLFWFYSLHQHTKQFEEAEEKKSLHLEDENSSSASLFWRLIGPPRAAMCVGIPPSM